MKKFRILAILLLSLVFCGSAFAFAFADSTETSTAGNGVIVQEHSFVEVTAENLSSWGGMGALSDIAPKASTGNSMTKFGYATGWWQPAYKVSSPFNVLETLGVSYDGTAKTTDLGVAVWVYIADEETLTSIKANGLMGMRVGTDADNAWQTAVEGSNAGKMSNLALVVGWNEVVMKANLNWLKGNGGNIEAISYVQINMVNLGSTSKNLAVNNIRLVKTSQTTDVVINRTEAVGGETPNPDEGEDFIGVKGEGVIAYQTPYVDIATSDTSKWGDLGTKVTDVVPKLGNGSSMRIDRTVAWWCPNYTQTTAVDVVNGLGISYTDSASDLGVAVWVYIGDETTLNAFANATFSMNIGESSSAYWITGSVKASTLDLVIGWNEVVFKQNIAWKAGANASTLDLAKGITYVKVLMEGMTDGVTKKLAINDVRLVKTTQAVGVLLNRTEAIGNVDPNPDEGETDEPETPTPGEGFIGTEGEGVIVYEHSFAEPTEANFGAWGATGIMDVAPTVSEGSTITKFSNPAKWWLPEYTLETGYDVTKTLAVSYDETAKTSDLGVAFWLYVHDEATLNAIKSGVVGVRLGVNSSNRWQCAGEGSSAGKLEKFDVQVGWNEFVIKLDVAWKTGTPSINNIKWLQFNFAGFGVEGASLGINNIRFVKTNQTAGVVLNRFEEKQEIVENPSVIVKEMPLCEITKDNHSAIGGERSGISSIAPSASTGNTMTYFNNPDIWWSINVHLNTPIKPIEALGVNYDAKNKQSDLALAFWLFVGDEETLDIMQNGQIGMKIGPSSSKLWITGIGSAAGKINRLDLQVGWNEIVIRQNAAWTSGAPGDLNEISYVHINISDFKSAGAKLAINNIRLVKTKNYTDVYVNAYEEIGYDTENSVEFLTPSEDNLSKYYPDGATLSDDVPNGFTGKSVKLPKTSFVEKTFVSNYNAAEGINWLENENAVLAFWLKITGITEFKYAMEYANASDDALVMFTDKNGASIFASLKDSYSYLNEGWNKIMIKTAGTGFDFTAISQIIIYNDMGIEADMSIYGLCFARANYLSEGCMINNATFGNGYWNKMHNSVISLPETVDGWENVEKVQKVGNGLVEKNAVVVNSNVDYFTYTADLDLTTWNEQFITISFWLYVSDSVAFANSTNYVYVAESRDEFVKGNYYEFNISSLNIVKGWNQVRARLISDALCGEVNPLNVRYFYFEIPTTTVYSVAVSELTVYESSVREIVSLLNRSVDVSEEAPNPEHKVVFDSTSSIDKWDQHAFGVMPYSTVEGCKSIYLTSEAGILQTRLRTAPVDISGFNFNHTVLTFWFYVNDVDLMGELDASIELGGGMLEDDSNEFAWEFRSVSLRGFESNKWHKVALRIIPRGLSKSNETGVVDLTSLRFMRMYWIGTGNYKNVEVLISNIMIEEMDTSSFYEKVTVVEKRDFVEGTTPGAIDIYDMIESADGTFPQERPGSNVTPNNPSDDTTVEKNGCKSAMVAEKTFLFVSLVAVGFVVEKLSRKRKYSRN